MSKSENNRFQWSIIGHAKAVSYLQKSLVNQKISQAYLFVGPKQVGKATVAKYFVDSLICKNLEQKNGLLPCGQCDSCRQLASQLHPDVYWLEREIDQKSGKLKKNISIEQVRQLQNKLSLRSFLNSYKIAVIDEAQGLSAEAANSLLKTLEEPSARTVLILLAENLARLPQTIVSRCQIINFLPVSSQAIIDYLKILKVERKKAKILAALAFGRPGIALNYATKPEAYLDFQEQAKKFITLLKSGLNDRFKIIGELLEFNDVNSAQATLLVWRKILRDLILVKYSTQNLISNLNLAADLNELAANYRQSELIEMMAQVNEARRYLEANVSPKLTLENLVLNF